MLKILGAILASPLGGGLAGVLFTKDECASTPGGELGGIPYGGSEICTQAFNAELAAIVTFVGYVITGIVIIWEDSRPR